MARGFGRVHIFSSLFRVVGMQGVGTPQVERSRIKVCQEKAIGKNGQLQRGFSEGKSSFS